ncbi:ethanolaminephosphotransferase 1 [Biomphalaria glabrata]|uniref:Ethanolaminephosphotransferase 1-like n=1 Tax=Biomphalaria glabrata TaxID=6526 RepID=A0A2C9JHQ4_BIOGL|nr:ethanolaminephosphotransferase 1-like [Biomphalaria glabrata]KAI8749600.1 ethanolaminephosphotransferase 1-like [Biomphalaria glabrata]
MAAFVYLSREVLSGFDNYKYSAIDSSPVSNYICHPFWNFCVKFVPLWIAPNVLTLTGFLLLLVNFIVMTYYDPHFYAGCRDHPEHPPIPNWVWLMGAINTFLAHTLDGIDGKQARRTKSSSPLGELFDHGLDSWATLFLPVAIFCIFGRGEHGVNVFRVFLCIMGIMVCFVVSHWEKYNTGVLFLPWSYDIGQLTMILVYLATYYGGHNLWKFQIPVLNISPAEGFELSLYVGFLFLTFPFTFYNIYRAYKDKTGKMLSISEGMRPLVSTFILFALLGLWIHMSSCEILDRQPRLFYWTTGTAFSHIACYLIIAQMSSTRCELINTSLLPLFTIVLLVSVLHLGTLEIYLLWFYCIYITLKHVTFGVCVVKEMCQHFKIQAFSLSKVNAKEINQKTK